MGGRRFVALVGVGYWGKNIFRNLLAMEILHTVCDTNEEVLKSVRLEYPEICYTTSFEDVLKNPEIEALVIATPAKTHYELVKQAFAFRKDVFVEKPLSLRVVEGQELVELARNNHCILMVGHILQYHPAVRKLKEMVRGGMVGEIRYIYANRLNIGKIRTEENVLWSFAPHDVSVMLSILEKEPLRVLAFGNDGFAGGIYDTVLVALEFVGGVKGHIFVSWLHPFKEQRLVLVGSQGMIVFDDVAEHKLLLYPHRVRWDKERIPIVDKAACEVVPVESKEPLWEELSCFVECVQKRVSPPTDGEEALRVLQVLEAAERSLRGGTKFGRGILCS